MAARLLLLAGLLAAAPLSAAPADCPNAGLGHVPATFVTAQGRYRYALEIAATPGQQECGMMFRRSVPNRTGMVFPFDPPRPANFWMDNTLVGLDIIFVGSDHRVLNIAARAVPLSRAIVSSNGDAASVIELAAGEAARIGLKAGDTVLPR